MFRDDGHRLNAAATGIVLESGGARSEAQLILSPVFDKGLLRCLRTSDTAAP